MNKKIIYQFTVSTEQEVEEEKTSKRKNKETGEMETVTTSKVVKKPVPSNVIIYQPSRRQIEDADMEFSIEMSKCIKKGILTKAMLAKKYSDTGGLLTEGDSQKLIRLYKELGETQNALAKLSQKKKKTENEKKKESELTETFANTRREIVDLETNYQNLFNHTADTKAQNRAILWYMLNLCFIKQDEEERPLFAGESTEEKEDSYYELEESEDEIFDLAKEKLMTFVSFWYFSQNPAKEDFENLEQELDAELA
tara:strand:- start:36 stop:797 length:762 start_codon:yes stop_codon:yes gene_type:complete